MNVSDGPHFGAAHSHFSSLPEPSEKLGSMTASPRPVLYVAGPYTHPDPVENTHRAAQVATYLFEETRWVPMLPHTTLLWHAITPRPVDFWYRLDLAHMAKCDAMVRLPGASTGADAELEHAKSIGMEVVDFLDLPRKAQILWLGSKQALDLYYAERFDS